MAPRNYMIPLSNGILEMKHRKQIGSAVWLFLWLIDKSTKEQPDPTGEGMEGFVLGGREISIAYIAEQIGESQRSVHNHLDRLEKYGYVRAMPHAGGPSGYAVKKSKKFFRGRVAILSHGEDIAEREPLQEIADPPMPKVAEGSAKIGEGVCNNLPRNKEDIPRTIQGDTSKPICGKTPRPVADPRGPLFIDDFKTYWEHKNQGLKFTFSGRDGKAFYAFLKEHPEIDRAGWQKILNNRAHSPDPGHPDGICHDAPLYSWIGRAHQYLTGPKNRYWQPVNQKSGDRHGNGKTQLIASTLTAALERRERARQMAGENSSGSAGSVTEPAAIR